MSTLHAQAKSRSTLPIALALAGVVTGALVLGVAATLAGAASTPPLGSDLPFKAVAPGVANDVPRQCGIERWPVKTLSDADALSVSLSPVSTTVDALRTLPKPSSYPDNARLGEVERTTYRVTATLIEMKREDDRDIHLVIADLSDPTHTMIVELVDVTCEGAFDSAHRAQMESARAAFEAACGAPTTAFKSLAGTATLTGVGFFDVIHGQRGIAPNGIELHPVIAVADITCAVMTVTPSPTGSATSTPTATPTSTPSVCGGATGSITALDKQDEVVTVSGSGNMTGWYLISEAGNQRFDFPSGFTASGPVQIRSGVAQFPNGASELWWTSSNIWNNADDDDAMLFDCLGQLRSTFEDGVP